MRKWVFAVAVTTGAALALAAPSFAATTVDVKAQFNESLVKIIAMGGCPVQGPEGSSCGTGQMLPFGSATENIVFGAGVDCLAITGSPTCDLRTITVPQGVLVTDEVFSSPSCPGGCHSGGLGFPSSGTLTDYVLGTASMGVFQGASGTLSGSVSGTVLTVKIRLSGQITLP
jgi:hypothetical protein